MTNPPPNENWQYAPPPGSSTGQPVQPSVPPGGYPPPGAYAYPPVPPPPTSHKWIIIAMVVLAGLAGFGGVVTAILLSGGDNEPIAIPPAESSWSAPSSASPSTTSSASADCDRYQASPTSGTPAGWQTVIGKRGYAYDVPAQWEINSCTTIVGWEAKCADGPFGYCIVRAMTSSASLRGTAPTCTKKSIGLAGVPAAKESTSIEAALAAEAKLVPAIYSPEDGPPPAVALGEVKQSTVGGRPAVQQLATVTGIKPEDCAGTEALHSMVATTNADGKIVMFVISLSQGVPGADGKATIDQMNASLRPAELK